jgi:uncharacterized protein YbjT (DUF2867 family)
MIKPKILVTGATGRTGGAVVTQLLAKGYPVRATVRVQDARSDLLQRRGAEIVVADIFDPGQLMDGLREVQRAYYCPPGPPRGHSMWRRLPAARRGKKIWVLRLRMSSKNANNQTKLNRGKR